jgi:hypothetical protein
VAGLLRMHGADAVLAARRYKCRENAKYNGGPDSESQSGTHGLS